MNTKGIKPVKAWAIIIGDIWMSNPNGNRNFARIVPTKAEAKEYYPEIEPIKVLITPIRKGKA